MAPRKLINGSRLAFIAVLLVLAFGVRMGAVVVMRDIHSGPSRSTGGADGVEYDSLGEHVASGLGYTSETGAATAFRAPGFPLFLAGIYRVFGHNYPVAYLGICLLGAVSCLLTYFLAREFLDERLARIAGALAVVYMPHIYLGTMFETEVLFAPCLALILWLLVRHIKKPSTLFVGMAGLILGFAALTRPFALLLLPLLMGVLLMARNESIGKRLMDSGIFAVLTLAVIAPWTIRNDRMLGKPVLLTTNGGSTFYGGNNDVVVENRAYWGGWIATNYLPRRQEIKAAADEVAQDKLEWKIGEQWVRGHLKEMPMLLVFKFARLWLPDISSANRKYDLFQCVTYGPFLVLFVLGAWQSLRNRACWSAGWMVLHSAILATVLTALIFWGAPRFRDAIAPVLMVYAAVGVGAVRSKSSGFGRRSLGRVS